MAFDNNVSPGTPPLNWQKIKDSFDVINQNFTQIGAAIAQYRPVTIINIDTSNPVKVTTNGVHELEAGTKVNITTSGVSQLDGNEYYVAISSPDELLLYTDALLTTSVDGAAHDAYPSSGGVVQGFSPFANLDFDVFRNNIIPSNTGLYNLGSATKQWKEVHIEPGSEVPDSENNGLWLGSAQIRGNGTTIRLPAGSTIQPLDDDADPVPILDINKTFFKEVQVDNGNAVVADEFVDSLNLISGTAMQLTVDSSAESITFANTGVTQLAGSTGISVSAATGNITLSNTGVTSVGNGSTLPAGLTVGSGIARDNTTGVVTFTNTGVIDLDDGFGITLSRDDATGIVTVTNAAPAVNTFGTFSVQGQADVQPDNTADTLEFIAGYGIGITTDGTNDKITFAFDSNVDINGSVFADDSTLLVDGVMGRIVADVYANVFGNVTGNTTGYHTGDVTGSVFADDSTRIVNAIDGTVDANIDRGTTAFTLGAGTISIVSGNALDIESSNSYDLTVNSGNDAYYYSDFGNTLIDAGEALTLSAVNGININSPVNTVIQGTAGFVGDLTGSVYGPDSTTIIDNNGTVIGEVNNAQVTTANLEAGNFTDTIGTITNGNITGFKMMSDAYGTNGTSQLIDATANQIVGEVNANINRTGALTIVSDTSIAFNSGVGVDVNGKLSNVANAAQPFAIASPVILERELRSSPGAQEKMLYTNVSTGTYEIDTTDTPNVYWNAPSGALVANFTGLETSTQRVRRVRIHILQGGTAYIPTIEVNGVTQTPTDLGAVSSAISSLNIYEYTFYRTHTNTWEIYRQQVDGSLSLVDTQINGDLAFYSDDGATLAGTITNNNNRLEFNNEDGTRMFYFDDTQNWISVDRPISVSTSHYVSTTKIQQGAGAAGDITIEPGSISGEVVLNGHVRTTATHYVQFGSFTTAERNALTAANGMVIYNSTTNKFQGYENGSWVNLIS